MKNLSILFNEKLLQLENIHSNYNYISLTIVTNKKIRKKSEKKFKLFDYTPEKVTNYTPTFVDETLRDYLYTDVDRYFFSNLRLDWYFDLDLDYMYHYDEYTYLNQYIYIGEVLNSKTLDSNGIPEFYGLYCERIFGPIIDYTCRCKQYYNLFFSEKRCDICFIELINSRVRRYRMSYTELLYPVIQIAYLPIITILLNSSKSNISITNNILKTLINLNILKNKDISILHIKSKIPNIFFSQCIFLKNLYLKDDLILEDIEENDLEDVEQNTKQKFTIFSNFFNNYRTHYIINQLYIKKKIELIKKFQVAQELKKINTTESLFYRAELQAIINNLTPAYFYQFVTFDGKKKLYNSFDFQNLMGADLIRSLLEKLDIKTEIWKIYFLLKNKFSNILDIKFLTKKLRILESFYFTNIELENLIISFIPILSPGIRSFSLNESDSVINCDINELYKFIIENNNLIMVSLFSEVKENLIEPRQYIQHYVTALINTSKNNKVFDDIDNNNKLKGIISTLKSKEGHFRSLVLGKRVDYSGRTIITPGPYLCLNQCAIPYEILSNLFEFYIYQTILKKLYKKIKNLNIIKKYIKIMFLYQKPVIFKFLKETIIKHKILLNRAPTLHKYGIQSFDIVINVNKNLCLHPLVCEGFNADFDGDQIGIHLPLSKLSSSEYMNLMQPYLNLFSSRSSQFILKPSHEMIIGCYYLSIQNNKLSIKIPQIFYKEEDALIKYFQKKILLHSSIFIKYSSNCIFFKKNTIYIIEFFNKNNKFKIDIFKCFIFKTKFPKIYLFTNIGLIICESYKKNIFYIKDIFYKTTIGKLLFYINCKNIIKDIKK